METSTELKKKEEKLNEQEEILNKKLKELEETNKIFKNKEKYLASFRKKVEDDCAWIENEAKRNVCKDVVYEIIFEIETKALLDQENLIDQNKKVCISTFNKFDQSLQNFIRLKTHFEQESKEIINSNTCKFQCKDLQNVKIIKNFDLIKSKEKKSLYEMLKLRNSSSKTKLIKPA